MDLAPQDGSTIELSVDGEWIEAYWSESAQDGSPHGTEGWAQVDGGYLILDAVRWRPTEQPIEYGEATPLQGHQRRQPVVVFGLGFGDESKGATVDFLSQAIPDAIAVVRWSGGANAAHNVRHGARHHTFRQFGSGTFLGLTTFLTEHVVVNLEALMAEAVELEDKGVASPLSSIILHGDSLITTPIHIAMNRAREILRGSDRHGSCGLGIGETIAHSYAESHGLNYGDQVGNFEVSGPTAHGDGILRADMLVQRAQEDLHRKIVRILEEQANYADPLIEAAKRYMPEFTDELWYGSLSAIAGDLLAIADSVDILPAIGFQRELEHFMEQGTVIFEGSQGLLLDEQWGFHPHTTWAQTEPSRLIDGLEEMGHRPYVLGLTRSYMTRHGMGPFPSEHKVELYEHELPADDNDWGRWQGGFRVAALDVPLLRYGQRVLSRAGIELDGLGVSHLDAFEGSVSVVEGYGGNADPSRGWHFEQIGTEDFPQVNSHVFLEERVLKGAARITELNSSEDLPGYLARELHVPTVLVARGNQRTDREFLDGKKEDLG